MKKIPWYYDVFLVTTVAGKYHGNDQKNMILPWYFFHCPTLPWQENTMAFASCHSQHIPNKSKSRLTTLIAKCLFCFVLQLVANHTKNYEYYNIYPTLCNAQQQCLAGELCALCFKCWTLTFRSAAHRHKCWSNLFESLLKPDFVLVFLGYVHYLQLTMLLLYISK